MNKAKSIIFISNIVKTLLLPVVVYVIIIFLSRGKFGTTASLLSMLRNSSQAIILAWGTMLITAAGMWDFSAGAQIYLSALLVIPILTKYELNSIHMILLLLLINFLLRIAVAVIYSTVHVKSMVSTLALAMILESAGKYFFGSGLTLKVKACLLIANAPWCFLILAVAAVIITIVWNYTGFAYHVRALGAGEQVARNIGINPAKIRFMVFLVQGIFLAFASSLLLASKSFIQPPTNLSSNTLVFNALMATFIGIALERYSNRIVGVAVGAIVMSMLNSGLLAIGVNSAWQMTVTGIFMALFIGFSTNQARIYRYFDGQKRAKEANMKFAQSKQSV